MAENRDLEIIISEADPKFAFMVAFVLAGVRAESAADGRGLAQEALYAWEHIHRETHQK